MSNPSERPKRVRRKLKSKALPPLADYDFEKAYWGITAPPEMRIIKEIQKLNRGMKREWLGSRRSLDRYREMYGAQRALRWALGIVRYSPMEIIHDKKKLAKAAQKRGW